MAELHVITALVGKYRQLSGKLLVCEKEAAAIQSDLAHLSFQRFLSSVTRGGGQLGGWRVLLRNLLRRAREEVGEPSGHLLTASGISATLKELTDQIEGRLRSLAIADDQESADVDHTMQNEQKGMPESQEEKKRRVANGIEELTKELPPAERRAVKAESLMNELPIAEGYEAFEEAYQSLNRDVEQVFASRLGLALSHHPLRVDSATETSKKRRPLRVG